MNNEQPQIKKTNEDYYKREITQSDLEHLYYYHELDVYNQYTRTKALRWINNGIPQKQNCEICTILKEN